MTKLELVILISLIIFDVGYIVIAPFFYARRWGQTYVETCKEIYGAMFAGVPDAFRSFLKWCTTLPALLKKLVVRYYVPFCIWLESQRRIRRPRFCWGYDLECEFRSVLTDYAYDKFEPYVNVHSDVPSVIQLQYITQKAATDDEVQECLECLVMKFRHYCTAYNLTVQFFPYFIRNGCEVNIFILYCEYEQELPDFYKVVNQVIMTKTSGNFGTLKECNIPKRNGNELILGYSAKKWSEGGIVSPFVWCVEKNPHLCCGGVTGAGKSTACMLLIRQLLQRKADITILDFKGATGDWQGIFKADRYAEYLDCDALFDKWYQEYLDLIEKKEYKERYLVIDEYGSFVLHKSSKEQKDFFNKLSHIAYTGRSWGARLLIINQFYSAEILPSGVKDQMSTRLYFGNRISVTTALSLFPGVGDAINKGQRLPNYTGYITAPNTDLDIIVIPELTNPQQLKKELQALGQKYYE